MGIAPSPWFKGGSLFIKGLGNVERELFHLSTKPAILEKAGKYYKVVGNNPDVMVKDGLIILKGTGPYSGKVFKTCLSAIVFF